jgi:hypothetical protein
LAQCHDGTGGFYFKDVQEQIYLGLPENGKVYCCKAVNVESDYRYKKSSFKDDSWHYIIRPNTDTIFGTNESFLNGDASFFYCEEF